MQSLSYSTFLFNAMTSLSVGHFPDRQRLPLRAGTGNVQFKHGFTPGLEEFKPDLMRSCR